MSIKDYMDDLEDLLDQAHPIPFVSHKVIIDGERMQELINAARQDIPSEISRAKAINDECDQVIERAKLKAERIIQEAEIRSRFPEAFTGWSNQLHRSTEYAEQYSGSTFCYAVYLQ